ncbi:MAG: TRAP transporter small permease [Chloroflexi bacterium]|nr:TRAP transporter small permease [Chloroflexota bacterium]
MKLLDKAVSVYDRVIDFMAGVAWFLVMAMMLLICYEVFARYVFGRAQAWAMEIAEYMLYFLALLGAPWLLKHRGHVRVDIVVERISPGARTLLNIITSTAGMLVCLVFAWYAGETAWDNFRRGIRMAQTIPYPKGPLLALIPLASFLLAIEFLRQTRGHIRDWKAMVRKEQKA